MSEKIDQNEIVNNLKVNDNTGSQVATNMSTTNVVGTATTYVATSKTIKANETKERKTIRENYEFFGLISILYALFYTFCVYKNNSGITIPFLQIGTFYYYILVIKKMDMKLKKDSLFYMISIMLLGISICLTDDSRLIVLSKLGIILLFMSFMLHHFYDDSKWSLSKYLESVAGLSIYTIAAMCDPFVDAVRAIKARQKKENGKLKYILIGIAITIPLIFIIMLLLLSADRIFSNLFSNIIDELLVLNNLFTIILMVVLAYIVIYSFINALARREIKEEVKDRRTQEPIIAITCLTIISVVYILFCVIQIVGLFMGQMQLPEGYTYAKYAREGFFQLLFVCGINIIIVLSCMSFFRESKLLKIMLTIISVCTYIMIASSAYRMILYISVYQLTFLRIFVLWSLCVIAFVMFGILINIYKEEFPLFRYSMVIVTVLYIGLAFSHPDYFIASYYIHEIKSENYSDKVMTALEDKEAYSQYGDIYYITSLSADAAPALVNYTRGDTLMTTYFVDVKKKYKKMNIRSFNFSRYVAGKEAKEYLTVYKLSK